MHFKLAKRMGTVINVNLRAEKNGKDGTTPASDIKIKCRGTKRDVDMLFPTEEGYDKYSDLMFNAQGHYLAPYDRKHKIERAPEEAIFTIYDQSTKPSAKLTFKQCSVKGIEVEFNGGKHQHEIVFTVQVHPDLEKDLPRLAAIQTLDREFEIEAAQDDVFDTGAQDQADNDPGAKGGPKQTDVEDGAEEEEEEEEEEEDED
jgi:hypothetical protein